MTLDRVDLHEVAEDEWELWRDLRLRMLAADPDAFGSTVAREEAFTEADWRRRIGGSPSFVALVDGRPLGTGALVQEESGSWAVVAMWVDPSARGRGTGRRVLEHLLSVVPADAEVFLWVADDNPARGLYESVGFTSTGERAPIRPGATLQKSRMRLTR